MPKAKSNPNLGPEWADSMRAAAGVLRVDRSVVKLAKDSGDIPQAFVDSRVNVPMVAKWMEDNKERVQNPPISKEQADIMLKQVRIQRETFALERDKGLHIRRTEVFETCKSISQHQRAVLQRKLEVELPPKLVGLAVIEIAETMRATVDEICRIFHDRTNKWSE